MPVVGLVACLPVVYLPVVGVVVVYLPLVCWPVIGVVLVYLPVVYLVFVDLVDGVNVVDFTVVCVCVVLTPVVVTAREMSLIQSRVCI